MKKSKFTEEQIVRILQEAGTGEKTQAQVCRDHGISVNTFYVWKRKYGGMETRDVRLLRELEAENAQLKRIVANQALEIDAVRALFRKNGIALPNPSRERGF
jgi:putative transposase